MIVIILDTIAVIWLLAGIGTFVFGGLSVLADSPYELGYNYSLVGGIFDTLICFSIGLVLIGFVEIVKYFVSANKISRK